MASENLIIKVMIERPESLTAIPLEALSCVRHAFFTRRGGFSEGAYTSLNCGLGSDDNPEAVRANRAAAAMTFDLPADALTTIHQIHSSDVLRVDKSCRSGPGTPKADAMVTDCRGIVLGILTADCAPVLFADADAGVIGAAHAGWKGALNGILEATVRTMLELGAQPDRIAAAVGPCIHQVSYEVRDDFRDRFVIADADYAAFFAMGKRAGHCFFDLPGFSRTRLERLGIGSVTVIDADTCADEERFFSYRRGTLAGAANYGRGLSAIALKR
jgi:YfiH family protein